MKERRPHSISALSGHALRRLPSRKECETGNRSRLTTGIFFLKCATRKYDKLQSMTNNSDDAQQCKMQGIIGRTFTSESAINQMSYIETEEDYIAILYDVFFAFQAQFASFPDMCLRAISDQIINAVDFSFDKAFLKIRVDYTSALRCF